MASLNDLMISRVRTKILKLFFQQTEEMYYVREITRATKEEINAVRRELSRQIGCGLLKSEKRGNRLYYYLNKRYLFYQELERMVSKVTGLGAKIRKLRRKLGSLDYVMLSGKFVRGLRPLKDEVDAFFVGDIVLTELKAMMVEEEKKLERELNYGFFTKEEFEFRKTRRDPFVLSILYSSRVMIIGSEEEFVEIKREVI